MKSGLDSLRPIVGEQTIDELHALAAPLRGKRIQHINATRVGGGVAELLGRIVPLMNELGLVASWDVLSADEEFFRVTKSFHNAIQGEAIELSAGDYEVYVQGNRRNSESIALEGDFVILHDPQPCALIERRKSHPQRCIWRCHIDASHPHRGLWTFLSRYLRRYDAAIFSTPVFTRPLAIPQYVVAPAIDPLSDKNRTLELPEVLAVLEGYRIDAARPILTQISRFDRFKDPLGVIQAFRMVRETNDCQLVLAGGAASDDPEGAEVLAEVREAAGEDPDIHVLELPPDAHRTVNALQRSAAVVLQKSLKEGFGLTVSEALWKGRPVIGGATGGIPLQVLDGINGYLVYSAEGAAFRTRHLLNHPEAAVQMGRRGVDQVRQNFLLTRNIRDYLLIMNLTLAGATSMTL